TFVALNAESTGRSFERARIASICACVCPLGSGRGLTVTVGGVHAPRALALAAQYGEQSGTAPHAVAHVCFALAEPAHVGGDGSSCSRIGRLFAIAGLASRFLDARLHHATAASAPVFPAAGSAECESMESAMSLHASATVFACSFTMIVR